MDCYPLLDDAAVFVVYGVKNVSCRLVFECFGNLDHGIKQCSRYRNDVLGVNIPLQLENHTDSYPYGSISRAMSAMSYALGRRHVAVHSGSI